MAKEKRELAEEGQDNIVVGDVYKEKNGDLEVIPFFVDIHSAHVKFAPVGRATEDNMRTSDFLNRFEYFGPVSARAQAFKA